MSSEIMYDISFPMEELAQNGIVYEVSFSFAGRHALFE